MDAIRGRKEHWTHARTHTQIKTEGDEVHVKKEKEQKTEIN